MNVKEKGEKRMRKWQRKKKWNQNPAKCSRSPRPPEGAHFRCTNHWGVV